MGPRSLHFSPQLPGEVVGMRWGQPLAHVMCESQTELMGSQGELASDFASHVLSHMLTCRLTVGDFEDPFTRWILNDLSR